MLTIALVLLGLVLIALTLADQAVRRLPLTPAVIYLAVGYAAGGLLGAPSPLTIEQHAPALKVATELAVLVSLFAVGLRLGTPPTWLAWRVALLMAGPGMVVAIALGAAAAQWLLETCEPRQDVGTPRFGLPTHCTTSELACVKMTVFWPAASMAGTSHIRVPAPEGMIVKK